MLQRFKEKLTSQEVTKVVNRTNTYFSSLPPLPDVLTEFIVKVIPYLVIVGAYISLIFGPLMCVISLIYLVTQGNPLIFLSTLLLALLWIPRGFVLLWAYKPLKARKIEGWTLLYVAEAIVTLETLVRISFGQTKIITLLGPVFCFYLLAQMKSYYKK